MVPSARLERATYSFSFVAVTSLRGLSLDHTLAGLDRGRPVSAPSSNFFEAWLRIAHGMIR